MTAASALMKMPLIPPGLVYSHGPSSASTSESGTCLKAGKTAYKAAESIRGIKTAEVRMGAMGEGVVIFVFADYTRTARIVTTGF